MQLTVRIADNPNCFKDLGSLFEDAPPQPTLWHIDAVEWAPHEPACAPKRRWLMPVRQTAAP